MSISLACCLSQFDFRTRRFLPRVIPMSTYALMTSLFLSASVLNNLALDYNISIPVHTVFRSSGLAGTLITGYLMFGKRSGHNDKSGGTPNDSHGMARNSTDQ